MQHHDNVSLDDRPVTMEIISSAPPTDSRGTGQNRRSFARRGGRSGPIKTRGTPSAQELDAYFRDMEQV
jgi:hypothetical protein